MKFKKLIHKKKKSLAVLIDPDKFNPEVVRLANLNNVSFFLVGGSRLYKGDVSKTVRIIKTISHLPVILFPGDETQLCAEADGVFILSLLSGRNTEYLIDKLVRSAPRIKDLKLKTFPVAYILLDGGKASQTQKVTQTLPISLSNKEAILNTCLAAQMLGFKAIYLEAGSGAAKPIPSALISEIASLVKIPLLAGGGVNSSKIAQAFIKSGANVVVVGNALEKNVLLLNELSAVFK